MEIIKTSTTHPTKQLKDCEPGDLLYFFRQLHLVVKDIPIEKEGPWLGMEFPGEGSVLLLNLETNELISMVDVARGYPTTGSLTAQDRLVE
jgi:hypothetical protein